MNYIYSYYQKIQDGSVTVNQLVRLAYEMVIKGLQDKEFFFDEKKGNKAIKFVEGFCRHHEGALAPNKIVREEWQKAATQVVFGVVGSDGFRQYREILLGMGRKNGKTLLAAAWSNYCAFCDGEYGGRIYFAAPKLQQAALCYDACYQMIKKEPELDHLAKKRRTDIYIDSTNTSIAP